MKKDELLDLVNNKDEVIGTVWKSEAHQDPTKIHREVAICVFNDRGETLIQRRSMQKINGPGEWKIAVAGHVESKEDPADAIKREVFEELGLELNSVYFKKEFAKRGSFESRFFYIYHALVKGKPELKFNTGEVMDVKWIKPVDLIKFAVNNEWDTNGLSHKTIIEVKEKLDY